MRTLLIVLTALTAFQACNQQHATEPAFNEQAETAAIMKSIVGETNSFYQRDYEGWKKHYLQTDYAFQGWNNEDGTFDAQVGWKAVDQKIGNYIRTNPLETGTTAHPRVERKNIVVHFFGQQAAYLVWDQYNSDSDLKYFLYSKEERIMEKVNGEWKIASVSAFWDYKNRTPINSL